MKLDLDTTLEGKKYFYTSPPLPDSSVLKLEEKQSEQIYDVIEQHLSIYEDRDDGQDYFTTYHFTFTLQTQDSGEQIIVRCYFDEQGIFKHLTAKINNQEIPISAKQTKDLRNYAELQCLSTINQLNAKINQRLEKLSLAIRSTEHILFGLSKNLDKNIINYTNNVLEIIALLEEFNHLDQGSLKWKEIAFKKLLKFCQSKQQAKEKNQQLVLRTKQAKKEVPQEMQEVKHEVIDDLKSDQKALESKRMEKLTAIREEVEKRETDDSELLTLLKQKLDLLGPDDFNETTDTMIWLNQLETSLEPNLTERAIHGDKAAIDIVIKHLSVNGALIRRAIQEGNGYFLETAYQHKPFPLNSLMLFTISEEEIGYTYLRLAYVHRSANAFVSLLKIGANPNFVFLNGLRLIHLVAEESEIFYAEQLQKHGADLLSTSNAQEVLRPSSIMQSHKPHEKPSVQNLQTAHAKARLHAMTTQRKSFTVSATPLMKAVYHDQRAMVIYLLAQKADPLVTGSNGNSTFNAISLATYSFSLAESSQQFEKKPLNLEIIRTLLQTGKGSIDERIPMKDMLDPSLPPGEITSLYHACEAGYLQAVKQLVICFSANPNLSAVKDDKVISTPFSTTLRHKDPKVFTFLVNQDVVPLDEKNLLAALAYLEHTGVDEKYTLLKENQRKGQLLKQANQAFDTKDYKTAVARSNEALALCKVTQHNRNLYKINAMAHAALGEYKKACASGERYIGLLGERCKKNWHPCLEAELKAELAHAKQCQAEMQGQLTKPEQPCLGFWQLPAVRKVLRYQRDAVNKQKASKLQEAQEALAIDDYKKAIDHAQQGLTCKTKEYNGQLYKIIVLSYAMQRDYNQAYIYNQDYIRALEYALKHNDDFTLTQHLTTELQKAHQLQQDFEHQCLSATAPISFWQLPTVRISLMDFPIFAPASQKTLV